jgi:hypothetical protein
MALGRPKAELVVRAAERAVLAQWARRPKTAQALAQRARIVLACATGAANTAVAARVGVVLPSRSEPEFGLRRNWCSPTLGPTLRLHSESAPDPRAVRPHSHRASHITIGPRQIIDGRSYCFVSRGPPLSCDRASDSAI